MGRAGIEPATLGLRAGAGNLGRVRLCWSGAGLHGVEGFRCSAVFGGLSCPHVARYYAGAPSSAIETVSGDSEISRSVMSRDAAPLNYAGSGNEFWPILARVGLTPRQLAPREFRELPKYGIGLTDLAKYVAGADESVAESDFDVECFRHTIENAAPRALAFNGKRAAGVFFDRPTSDASYGCQAERIGDTVIFILPSTSGSARRYWDESHWRDLAEFVKTCDATQDS
jgi:TDG/mug DNA glycosylase family protein